MRFKFPCDIFVAISKEKIDAIRIKYKILQIELDERGRRMWAAVEAKSLGHGGVFAVTSATGLAESTIRLGRHEIASNHTTSKKGGEVRRIRKKGGGRKPIEKKDSDLPRLLDLKHTHTLFRFPSNVLCF